MTTSKYSEYIISMMIKWVIASIVWANASKVPDKHKY